MSNLDEIVPSPPPSAVTPDPLPVIPEVSEFQPEVIQVVEPEIVPAPSPFTPEVVPSPVPSPADVVPSIPVTDVAVILEKVASELKSFLAGNKLTLSNITGVVIDLYNSINSFKSLTTNQKSMLMSKVLTDFVKNEMDSDPTILAVIDTLVPRIVETVVGVSNGTINVGEIIEDIEEKASGCFSCFSKLFKK